MDFYRKADDFVLLDLLAVHTNRLTQLMIYGETFKGEYSAAKHSVELLQDEILARQGFYVGAGSYSKSFNQSSAVHTGQCGQAIQTNKGYCKIQKRVLHLIPN